MDFDTFYAERCKFHNRALGAPPGINLPEAGAAALSDFLTAAAAAFKHNLTDEMLDCPF